ncbi:hypothetical protein BU15DRAFT_81516 [Melanogaster broomeanus]|nr:hypothetical protein BU15DRAFT_81516 [Melanogaster broomeanus]
MPGSSTPSPPPSIPGWADPLLVAALLALFGLIIVAALFVSGRLLLCNRRYGEEDVESRGRNQGSVMVQRWGTEVDLVPPPPVYTSTGKPPSYSSKEDLSAGHAGQAREEDEPGAAPVARPTQQ